MEKKTILSGIKPTGRPHLGNYFGFFKQMIDLQNNDAHVFAMIADYHALNFIQDADKMREFTHELAVDYLALGFDAEKNILFKQSDIPEHTELAWIFDTITTMPYLERGHAYKDAVEKASGGMQYAPGFGPDRSGISVGTFNYPMLMAADILLYSPDLVPVGLDQKQHIEFARDTAEKFNRTYGKVGDKEGYTILKLPEPMIMENVQTVPGIDGRKMSKSYGNYISLFAEDKEIEEKVMAIVTDSKAEYPENVFYIHKLFRPVEELDKIYEENKGKYKVIKEMLIEDMKAFIAPLRESRKEVAANPDKVKQVLETGKEKARAVARAKMEEVKRAVGVI